MVVAHNELYESDSRTGLQSGQAPHGGSPPGAAPWKGREQGPVTDQALWPTLAPVMVEDPGMD